MALFTYLSVFDNEWKDGNIRAHGMFWCVKAPIMVIFYFGDILLAVLSYFNVIKDKLPSSPSGTLWHAAAIKNGYYVLIICVCMCVVSMLMQVYFGLDEKEYQTEVPEYTYFGALSDSFLAYIPQFLKNVFMCGGDTVVLAKKRIKLRKDRRPSDDERDLLDANLDMENGNSHDYMTQSSQIFQDNKYDQDLGHYQQQHNFNALPLEPLGTHAKSTTESEHTTNSLSRSGGSTGEVDELAVVSPQHPQEPPPPLQSRAINRNDEISLESLNSRSNHFTPHDLERK